MGFSTKSELEQYKKQQLQIKKQREERERQKRIAEKKEEERLCKKDLQCWGQKNANAAAVACDGKIEKLAKYDFEWTDGFFEPKFSRSRWRNKDRLIITYIGDKIKLQNGFGAWQRYTYECDYDTERDLVLKVSARPGRIK